MNSLWQDYLRNHHAFIKDSCVIHFGDIKSECKSTQTSTIMTDLSHYGLIRLSGEDAPAFLQSQLSCDVREINSQKAQYGSYCTPKGRVLASFLLWQEDDNFLMQLPINLCASIQKRLSLYILRAKVLLANISDDFVRIGIAGPDVAKLITKVMDLEYDLDQSLHFTHHKKFNILSLTQHRIELFAPVEIAPFIWEHLRQHARPAGSNCWDWLDIQAGIPFILPETQEAFLPQMINLDMVGGISFKKGCYPGQEIIARTQYLGKLKRRMFLAHLATSEIVKAGDALYSIDMYNQPTGNIVNAAFSPDGGFDVLAVIQQSSVDTCEIHWKSHRGPILEIKPLPYLSSAHKK